MTKTTPATQATPDMKALAIDWTKLLAFLQYLITLFNQGTPMKAKKPGCDDQCECAHECLCHALQIVHHQMSILEECQVDLPK